MSNSHYILIKVILKQVAVIVSYSPPCFRSFQNRLPLWFLIPTSYCSRRQHFPLQYTCHHITYYHLSCWAQSITELLLPMLIKISVFIPHHSDLCLTLLMFTWYFSTDWHQSTKAVLGPLSLFVSTSSIQFLSYSNVNLPALLIKSVNLCKHGDLKEWNS